MRFRDPVRFLIVFWFLVLAGCDSSVHVGEWQSPGAVRTAIEPVEPYITLGDIEPDTPTDRMHKLRPLADHIEASMGWEPNRVQVRIARSVPEITAMMEEGVIDIYIDSSYPVLLVGQGSGSEILLESPVAGSRSYNSVLIASVDSEVRRIGDLVGRIIGLQEFYSTSGYLMPAAFLIEAGHKLEFTAGRNEPASDRIGYIFSGDEENSLSMLQQGVIDAGVMSGLDWARLPEEVRDEFVVIAKTQSVPRKMLALREGFDPSLIEPLQESLLKITDEQRKDMFENTGWSWEFLLLDEESLAGVERARKMIAYTRELGDG